MPYGYTECPICHETVSCRGLKRHLKEQHPASGLDLDPKKKEHIKPTNNCLENLIDVTDRFLPATDKIKSRKTKHQEASIDSYKIADRFIVNCINDGSLVLNIKQLIDDGRAKVNKNGDSIIITVQLAKFRKAFNKS